MKVAVNRCYGGFSLSPLAIKRIFELKGKPIYFYNRDRNDFDFRNPKYIPVNVEDLDLNSWDWMCSDIPNYHELTDKDEREKHYIYYSPDSKERADKDLIQAIEELGVKASGRFGEIEVVEIPDDVDFEIEEYDGNEWISEVHRTW